MSKTPKKTEVLVKSPDFDEYIWPPAHDDVLLDMQSQYCGGCLQKHHRCSCTPEVMYSEPSDDEMSEDTDQSNCDGCSFLGMLLTKVKRVCLSTQSATKKVEAVLKLL